MKLSNAKPITCACCGCVYEFESGDMVITEELTYLISGTQIVSRKLKCPNCCYENDIAFENENKKNLTFFLQKGLTFSEKCSTI